MQSPMPVMASHGATRFVSASLKPKRLNKAFGFWLGSFDLPKTLPDNFPGNK